MILLVMLTCATTTFAQKPNDVLVLLKSRDSQFDNVRLAYTMDGVKKKKDYSWRRMDKKAPRLEKPAAEVEYLYHDALIVRGSDITFHRQQPPEEISAEQPWTLMLWNNFEGVRTELVLYDERFRTSPGTLEIHRNPATSPDGESQHKMWVEFSLGFGFGRRLVELESVERTETGHTARGTMKLWRNDVTRCELELDDDFVVRKAVLDADADGNLNHIEVNTSGSVERQGFLFAERGHYLRRWEGRIVNGKRTGTPKVEAEYDIVFEDAKFNLPDDEYRRLIEIKAPLGTSVVDPHHIGITNVKCVTWAADPKQKTSVLSSRSWMIIFVNAVALTILLGVLWFRSHRHAAKTP